MDYKETLHYIVQKLKEKGADLVSCKLNHSENNEITLEAGNINLLRTTHETSISISAVLIDKKGSIEINKIDEKSINSAMDQVIELAKSSKPDPANIISERQEPKDFSNELSSPDTDLMYDRLEEFNKTCKKRYPETIIELASINFTKKENLFLNSNGTFFSVNQGYYRFTAMFTTKKGSKCSSFNYTDVTLEKIEKPLIDYGTLDTLLKQSSGQTEAETLNTKYSGDIIVTPDCLMDFFNFLITNLQDYSLIAGTSVYKDKLDKKIADQKLNLHASPLSDELVTKTYITKDGYPAKNNTIIENGVLITFLLSLYGAEKTGLKRATNQGGNFIIDPGDKSFDELVKSIKKGILVCRFSGGQPGKNGDFSGVAKNSYRIEDGKILNPVSETMISGNMVDALKNIKDISSERINFGYSIMPWIKFGNINISG